MAAILGRLTEFFALENNLRNSQNSPIVYGSHTKVTRGSEAVTFGYQTVENGLMGAIHPRLKLATGIAGNWSKEIAGVRGGTASHRLH
jgi:hypothetical protein